MGHVELRQRVGKDFSGSCRAHGPCHFQPGDRFHIRQRDGARMRSDRYPQTGTSLGQRLDDHAAEIDIDTRLALGVFGQQFDSCTVDQFQRSADVQDHHPRPIGRQRQERLAAGEKLFGQYPPPAGIVCLELQQHILPVRHEAADLGLVGSSWGRAGRPDCRRCRCPAPA